MSLSHSSNLGSFASPISAAVSSDFKSRLDKEAPSSHVAIVLSEVSKEQIRDMFNKAELSVSSYDTAWVAMVHSPGSPKSPRFPRSLSWLLNNQLRDGSWGLSDRHPLLIKDALLSTLACVLALKQWGVGERQINRGLEYVALSSASLSNERQHTPIGFHILLSGMIEQAGRLNLNLPLRSADLDSVSYKRNLELNRGLSGGSGVFLSYVSEGMGSLADWDMIMKHQRKNGSLFNSPSTTATALNHLQNVGCLRYLESVNSTVPVSVNIVRRLRKYKSGEHVEARSTCEKSSCTLLLQNRFTAIQALTEDAVTLLQKATNDFILRVIYLRLCIYLWSAPAIYPLGIYSRLCMIENLERLGIGRHFGQEIIDALDDTNRCWLQGEEEIFLDITTSAMAFRILRSHGYNVSSDALSKFAEEDQFCNTLEGDVKDTGCVLELYRASQLTIYDDEIILDKINSWTSDFLRKGLDAGAMHASRLESQMCREVDDALKFPFHANMERVANRRNIENYNTDGTKVLKCGPIIANEDFLNLAVTDFNNCQAIWQEEFKYLQRWVKEKKLDKLKFARQKSAYGYFSAAETFFAPQLSDARISWAKNCILITVADDFYDVGGSAKEHEDLIRLLKKWNVNLSVEGCSEQVEILFSAIRSTISETGDKASTWQGRNLSGHVAQMWIETLESMSTEAEWARKKTMPTMDEYIAAACVSFGLWPIVLPALYLVGPKLSEKQVESPEYRNLCRLMDTCGRLLNDIQSFKRESKQGKLNAVTLQMLDGSGTSEREAIERVGSVITSKRRELLKLVLQEKDSIIPRACKDLFWRMSAVMHLFYMDNDDYTSENKITAVKALLDQPITLNKL